nr:MAG TPA: hypothetical protein [Caudoviricetes sp.]
MLQHYYNSLLQVNKQKSQEYIWYPWLFFYSD